MAKTSEIEAILDSVSAVVSPDASAADFEPRAADPSAEPPVSQLALDAEALGYPAASADDLNSLQSMLEESLKRETKAAKKHIAWVAKNAAEGKELERAYTDNRHRTSRLYQVLTGGIGPRS